MPTEKTTYLFIHGAWHGRWCWQYITPLLRELGYDVFDPDLPGHGNSEMDFTDITLTTYVNAVTQLLMSIAKPVVLVGHSMAGVIISQIAENMPESIKQLIYINGFIPENNQSLLDQVQESDSRHLESQMAIDKKNNKIILRKTIKTKELLFNCCHYQDSKLGMSLLANEPLQPFSNKINLSTERFGSVEKLYISCLQDKVLLAKDQKRIYEKKSCSVINLNTDHSPFFSSPQSIVDIILNHT